MKIIAGENCTGKTKQLIEYSLENDIPILALTPSKADSLIEKSKAYFGRVVNVVDFKYALDYGYEGKVLIDDLDEVLPDILHLILPGASLEGFVLNV